MKDPLHIIKIGYTGLIAHICNYLASYFPNIFRPRPIAIDIYPTFRCNLKCIHCNYWQHKSQNGELSTDKWREIIINLKKWLGTFSLRICGGEPLMRTDLIDIVKFAHQQGIFTVLSTNGSLITKDVADRIIESGLDFISISLDSLKEGVYDYLRGEPGTYRKTRQAIMFLQGRINTLQIHTTIIKHNLDEILDLVRFCEDNGLLISFQGLYGMRVSKTEIANPKDSNLWPLDKSKISQIFDELLLKKRKGHSIKDSFGYLKSLRAYYLDLQDFKGNTNGPCLSYQRNFRIRYDGVVTFCRHYDSIGNITTAPPQKIWNSKEAFLIREKMKNCHRSCAFIRSYYNEGLLEKVVKFKDIILTRLTI